MSTQSATAGDSWLTTAEVAELIKIPADTVKFWRYRGTGPRYSRVGNYVRYRLADVTSWMEQKAEGGAA